MEISKIKELQGLSISKLEDLSDINMKRVRVHFSNGHQMSIVRGEYSYGGPEGLYEIALCDKEGELSEELLDEEDQGDSVLGWCNHEKIAHYLYKASNLP